MNIDARGYDVCSKCVGRLPSNEGNDCLSCPKALIRGRGKRYKGLICPRNSPMGKAEQDFALDATILLSLS